MSTNILHSQSTHMLISYLRKRAAAPFSCEQTATGRSRRTAKFIVARNSANAWSWSALGSDFIVPWNHHIFLDAGHLADITLIASRTTVFSIIATHSLKNIEQHF